MAGYCNGKDLDFLGEELAFFELNRLEWLPANEGRFALVKGSVLAGIYESETEAYGEGLKRFGNQPFLIKQITRDDPLQTLPALHYGLIRART